MRRLNGSAVSARSMSALARALDEPGEAGEPVQDPAERIRRDRIQAEEAGRREGMSMGLAQAEKEIDARAKAVEGDLRREHENAMLELEDTRSALAAVMGNIGAEVERLARHAEEVAIEAAYAAVLKVLGDRAVDRTLMRELCLHALTCAEQTPTALRVSVQDMEAIGDAWQDVAIMPDARFVRGQCALETRFGHYETGLDVRLEMLKRAFLDGLQRHRGIES